MTKNKNNIAGKGLLLASMVLLTSNVLAATPKTSHTITGDTITVGDVFDDAGDAAGTYLAPAPAAGGSITLSMQDLKRIASAFRLDWTPVADEKVKIVRASTDIASRDVKDALEKEIAQRLPGQDIGIDLSGAPASFHLPASAEKTFDISDLTIDSKNNRFTATLTAPSGSDTPALQKNIAGRLYALTSVPVLKTSLQPGDIISDATLGSIKMRQDDISANLILDPNKLIGQTVRRPFGAEKPLTGADIEAPTLVKKGEHVLVTLKNGSLQLTLQGRALEDGGAGDVVRIINQASNKTIDGIVTGAQTVEIRTTTNTL